MDEMNVEAIDLRKEIRHRVNLGFAFAPVVIRGPVMRELLHGRELHALRRVGDGFLVRPARRHNAALQVGEIAIREVNVEGTDRGRTGGGKRAVQRRRQQADRADGCRSFEQCTAGEVRGHLLSPDLFVTPQRRQRDPRRTAARVLSPDFDDYRDLAVLK